MASIIVATAISSGSRALVMLPKKISRIRRATGSTTVSARARSALKPSSVSCQTAASPPTRIGAKPGGVPRASRMAGIRFEVASAPSGTERVAKVRCPSSPTRSRLPVPKYETTRVPGTTAAARVSEACTAER